MNELQMIGIGLIGIAFTVPYLLYHEMFGEPNGHIFIPLDCNGMDQQERSDSDCCDGYLYHRQPQISNGSVQANGYRSQ